MGKLRIVAMLGALVFAAGTAIAQPAPTPAPRTPHRVAGRTDCLKCHGPGRNPHVISEPASHKYANGTCVACHRVAATLPPSSRHAMDSAHARCAICHVANYYGAKVPPASHAHFDAQTCAMCHDTAERSSRSRG